MFAVSRDITFDMMRGVGIILVIIGHLAHGYGIIIPVIYTFHMPFFFIISGYFYKNKDCLTLLKRDFHSLIVPYILVTLILLCYGWVISMVKNDFSNFTYWYDSLIKMEAIGPLWFLWALFWCRLIYNFLYRKINVNQNIKMIFLVFVSFVCYYAIPKIYNIESFNLLCILNGLYAMFFYSLGNVIRVILSKISHSLSTLLVLVLVVLFFISAYYSLKGVDMSTFKQNNVIMNIMVALSSFGIIYLLCRKLNEFKWSKYVIKFGTFSIVVYTVHTIMFRIVPFEKCLLVVFPAMNLQLRSLTIVALHLIITYYFCKFVEKNKACQLLFNIR